MTFFNLHQEPPSIEISSTINFVAQDSFISIINFTFFSQSLKKLEKPQKGCKFVS